MNSLARMISFGVFFILLMAFPHSSLAVTVLGTGADALLGGDLTDPECNIDDTVPGGANYDWMSATSSSETYFSPADGHEAAFDVFDNKVGGGEAKWCCDAATQWVQVQFDRRYQLTHFTIASGNDAENRDPTNWVIEGSYDGIFWERIFNYDNPGVSPFTARNQVLRYDIGVDYDPPGFYDRFRYRVEATKGGGMHQINEIELFGTPLESMATYDSVLGAPRCSADHTCDSGTLLERSGSMSPPELNQPNMVSGLVDGPYNRSYQVDESIERIVISGNLQPGSTVRIDVTFYAYGDGSSNYVVLFHTATGDDPNAPLSIIDILEPTQGGLQIMSVDYTLPEGSLQRVRAKVAAGLPSCLFFPANCPQEVYYDRDELLFEVKADSDGDGVADDDEFHYCEDDPDENCAQLSHQMMLASLLVLNDELTAAEFAAYKAGYQSSGQTELDYCRSVVDDMISEAQTAGLHPPAASDAKDQVCWWQPPVKSARLKNGPENSHCQFFDAESKANQVLMAQAEKVIGTGEGGVCQAFNFLANAGDVIIEIIGPDYNPRFVSLLLTALVNEVFAPDTAESLRVILDAVFPEQMCELGEDLLYTVMKEQVLELASDYLTDEVQANLVADHWSDNREDAIQGDLGIAFTSGYEAILETNQELAEAANICFLEAGLAAAKWARELGEFVKAPQGAAYPWEILGFRFRDPVTFYASGLAVSIFNQYAYYTCMAPIMKSAAFGDPQVREQFRAELEAIESQIHDEVESYNRDVPDEDKVHGEMAEPGGSGILHSYVAPMEILYEGRINPGYLDFESGDVFPSVVATPELHCDANEPFSDLMDTSEDDKASLRDDCVSFRHDGSDFDLVQTQCSNEVHILCDVEVFDLGGGASEITGFFVTEQRYSLEEADSACIAERDLEFSDTSITTAFASTDETAAQGALQNSANLDSDLAYGTGYVVCTEEPSSNSVLTNENFDYVQCDGGSNGTARGKKRANFDLDGEEEPERRPIKRKKGNGNRKETSEAIGKFRSEVITQLKQHLGLDILNHFTLPVGQGSCHIMQCIQVPDSLTNFADNVIIDNVVYDCGSDGYIGNSSSERADANIIPILVRWIADYIVKEGNQLLAKTLLNLVTNSSTDHVIVSHTDSDHNSLLNGIWQSGDGIPEYWTMGGRPDDFKRQPLQAIMRRLNAGNTVEVNLTNISSATSLENLRSQIPPLPTTERSLLADAALYECGHARMRLLTANQGIAPSIDSVPPGPAKPSSTQANSVSTVVTLEVIDSFVGILPGDGLQQTWTSAKLQASGTHAEDSQFGIRSFPIRYLASAHHGSFLHGSNDRFVDDYIRPTHVVFSHALNHKHVHNKAWWSYWDSVSANTGLADGAMVIKDSYQPENMEFDPEDGSPTSPDEVLGPITWIGDDGGAWQYKTNTTDVHKKALIGTYSNGFVWGSLLLLDDPTAGGLGFSIRRLRLDPMTLSEDIASPIFVDSLQ